MLYYLMQLKPKQTEQPLVASCSQFKGRIGLQFSLSALCTTLAMFFGKDWSLVLALLQMQTDVSKLAIRAPSDQYLESSRTEIKQICHPFFFEKALGWKLDYLRFTSTLMDDDLRYILPSSSLKRAKHLNSFVTLCFMSCNCVHKNSQNCTTLTTVHVRKHNWT